MLRDRKLNLLLDFRYGQASHLDAPVAAKINGPFLLDRVVARNLYRRIEVVRLDDEHIPCFDTVRWKRGFGEFRRHIGSMSDRFAYLHGVGKEIVRSGGNG